ncbi:hypothetical protein F5141DRAFT_1191315 [Pisolithus sp. B1]|nr:hypothetical protein F5141DRAFT_1191315 [Pisolithus sp. B1]
MTGVHFVLLQPCQCVHAESYHKQLLHTKLYPSTFEKPSMVFTFLVLDDFLRDNVECRMSGMNYYSKLHQVTSSVFPHLVPDRYRELLWVAWQWHLLKLLKWSGYQGNLNDSMKGDLAIFCMACPQLGINLLDDWRYTRTVVMDGNFKAEHMCERRPGNQVWLMDGHGFMVTCNNHKNLWRWVDNTKFLEIAPLLRIVVGIRMWHVHGHKKECYARYSPLFIRGSGWVNISASTCGMTSPHHQELLDFQMNDSNFMKMICMGMFGMGGNCGFANALATLQFPVYCGS